MNTPMEVVNEALALAGAGPQYSDPARWDEQLGESLALIYRDTWREAVEAADTFLATDPRAADLLRLTGMAHHPLVALYIIDMALRTRAQQ